MTGINATPTPQKNEPHSRAFFIKKTFIGASIFLVLLVSLTWGIRTAFGNNLSGIDFYISWAAAGHMLRGESPYSMDIAKETQNTVYGRPAIAGEDVKAYAFPLFVLFPFLPLARLDVQTAFPLYMAINILVMLTLAYFFVNQHPRWLDFSLIFFYPISFGLIVGNVSLIISSIVLAFLEWVVFNPKPSAFIQIFSGIFLAWCAGKPQFTWFILIMALAVAIVRKLLPFAFSLLGGGAGWIGLSFLVYPGWLAAWIKRLYEFTQYGHTKLVLSTYLAGYFPQATKNILARLIALFFFIIVITLVFSWYKKSYKAKSNINHQLPNHYLLWAFGVAGLITYIVNPTGFSNDQSLILMVLFAWAALSWKTEKKIVAWFWWIGLIVSWAAFILGRVFADTLLVTGLPILYYCVWIGYLSLQEIKRNRLTIQPNGQEPRI